MSRGEWFDSFALCSLNACACIALLNSLRSRRWIFRAKEEISPRVPFLVHSQCTGRDGILESQNKKGGQLSDKLY